MNRVVALVDLYNNNSLGLLTQGRPLGSTTFLGRYALIDFVLSNLSNSGVDNIGILVKDHANSINKHIGNANTYLANPKTGFLSSFINEKGILNPVFNTDIHNINENDHFLYEDEFKYVVIANPAFLMKTDYRELVRQHILSGKLASVLYKKVEDSRDFAGAKKLGIDDENNVTDIYTRDDGKEGNIFLDVMIIEKNFFKDMIQKSEKLSITSNVYDLISYIAKEVNKVNAIPFDGYVRFFNSLEHYFKYSLEYLENDDLLVNFINDNNWIFYTTTHNSKPVFYGEKANVSNSLISNGAYINGTVMNSIISRDVTIEEGATVENCILFTHTVVKKGVTLRNIVCDKRCNFHTPGKVEGKEDSPLYFPRGARV